MGRYGKRVVPRYDVKEPQDFAELIFFLDSYRVLQYTELTYIEKMVREGRLGMRFKEEWDSVRRLLIKMAGLPHEIRHILGWAKLQNMMNFVGSVTYPLVLLLLAILFFMTWGREYEGVKQITGILGYVSIPILGLVVTAKVAPLFIGKKISDELQRYRERNLEKFQSYENQIKEIVQDLIHSLAYEARRRKLRPKSEETSAPKLTLRVFNTDYEGIRVVKGAGRFRKFFEVELT